MIATQRDPAQPGRSASSAELIPFVYDKLKRLAAHRITGESTGQSLQASDLVHEAYLRLIHTGDDPRWVNLEHFFGAVTKAMGRILIDRARARHRIKRGGKMARAVFDQDQLEAPTGDGKLLAIDRALDRFAKVDPQGAEMVKMRYFVGLTFQEIAEKAGLSVSTVKRQWACARAWLKKDLAEEPAPCEKW